MTAEDTAQVCVNDERPQFMVVPHIGECEALRAELAVGGRDERFEDALGLGQLMLGGQ